MQIILILSLTKSQKMDIIVASSRGRGLEELLKKSHPYPEQVEVIFTPSATLNIITKEALKKINSLKSSGQDNIHAYIIGGYCDLTSREKGSTKINGRWRTYEEVVFWEDPESAVARLNKNIHTTVTEISNTNVTPIICTIPPANIETWNTVRKSQRKTYELKHTVDYPKMQQRLQDSLIQINRYIITLNMKSRAHTPKLANTVIQKKGKGKGYRVYFDNLKDGVHATDDTAKRWAEMIMEAIRTNRGYAKPTKAAKPSEPPKRIITVPSGTDSESESEHPTKRNKFTIENKV